MKRIQNPNGITVAELKEAVKNWPETDANGDPCEVWLGTPDGISFPCTEICPMNYRREGDVEWADIILEQP